MSIALLFGCSGLGSFKGSPQNVRLYAMYFCIVSLNVSLNVLLIMYHLLGGLPSKIITSWRGGV